MTEITIGTGVTLNLDQLIESRALIQAQSGGGKTTLCRRILEQSHGNVQQLVLDPEGEFYTLREKFDYIIAGKGGDCAADPRSAKLLARRLLELGVSAVCDLSELKAHDRIRFVRYFLEALIEAPRNLRHPALVVIDEAHLFCPEKGQAESAAAVIDLCTRGRKRGLCPVLATQRLSKLHKDAAAELRNVLIGPTWLDIDQQRAGDVLGMDKAARLALRDLRWGQFHAYGPAFNFNGVGFVEVGDTATKNPAIGREMSGPAQPTDKMRALLAKVADLPAEAEAEAKTLEDIKRELATTRRELTLAKKAQPEAVKPCDHAKDIAALETALDEKEQRCGDLQTRLMEGHTLMREMRENFDTLADRLNFLQGTYQAKRKSIVRKDVSVRREPAPAPRMSTPASTAGITGPEQRVLDAIAWWESIGVDAPAKQNIGFIAGYKVGKKVGGTFGNILGGLRGRGLLEYPRDGCAALTDAGRAVANQPEAAPTLEALHDAIFDRLGNTERRVLQVIVAAHPEPLTKQEAGERAGYQVGSKVGGTYGNILGRLRSLGLLEYPSGGRVVATDLLFPEGL